MAITATDVKKLRDTTGAGMMDAKKALTEAEGDFDKAIEILRISGQAKAAKRSDRDAANGLVAAAGNALIQLAAETDFVAKNEEFVALAQDIAQAVNDNKAEGLLAAGALTLWQDRDMSVTDAVSDLAVRIGEKLELKEAAYFDGQVSTYLHRRSQDLPPQVGVMVEYEGDDEEFVHGLCLQIAAMSPVYVTRDDVPGRAGRERAPDRRGHRPGGGQARGCPAPDRRGPPQRLLQGQLPGRPDVGVRRQEDRGCPDEGARDQRLALRALRRGLLNRLRAARPVTK